MSLLESDPQPPPTRELASDGCQRPASGLSVETRTVRLAGFGWEGLFTVVIFAAAPTTLAGYVAAVSSATVSGASR